MLFSANRQSLDGTLDVEHHHAFGEFDRPARHARTAAIVVAEDSKNILRERAVLHRAVSGDDVHLVACRPEHAQLGIDDENAVDIRRLRGTPEKLAARMKSDYVKWGKVVRDIGLKAE